MKTLLSIICILLLIVIVELAHIQNRVIDKLSLIYKIEQEDLNSKFECHCTKRHYGDTTWYYNMNKEWYHH